MTRTLCALALILFADPALAGDIVGNARVIDGDTIEIDGVRVHLHGIDAPELNQTCEKGGKWYRCGDVAAAALRKQATAPVRCALVEGSTPNRVLAKCIVGYIELNAWMVTRGYAVADRKNARDYVAKEAKARRALRGVWHGRFEYPWDWRKARQ
ncbi:MAG: thermonuclease family protein [Rhodospirillaceae bacterium]|nr:thermonuclease family protein [Rhodospirillaceae bacterium]